MHTSFFDEPAMLTDMIKTWSSTSFILVSMSTGMLYIMYISHQTQEHSNDNHLGVSDWHLSPNVTFNNFSTSAHWIWVGYNHLISNKCEWTNCFFKNAHKILRILPNFICKNNQFSACFNFDQTCTVTIFGEHGIMAHIPWWLSQSEL